MAGKHPVRRNVSPAELPKIMGVEERQETVLTLLQLRQTGPPQSDMELQDRLTHYFEMCAEGKICPGVESMAYACGVSRQSIYYWSKGEKCSIERQNMIIAAKGLLSAFVEQSMQKGQINPVAGIFLMKNWFGYKDGRTFEIEQVEDSNKATLTADQIRERLRQDIPVDDEVEFNEP